MQEVRTGEVNVMHAFDKAPPDGYNTLCGGFALVVDITCQGSSGVTCPKCLELLEAQNAQAVTQEDRAEYAGVDKPPLPN